MRLLFAICLLASLAGHVPADVIGTNTPPSPLTAERILGLPRSEQPAWNEYVARSERRLRDDQRFFLNEMRQRGLAESTPPPPGRKNTKLSLNRSSGWYSQPEALRIADIVLSFQLPSGGWSKNLDLTHHKRAPGEQFGIHNPIRISNEAKDSGSNRINWDFLPTFDNGATISEMRFLAKVSAGTNSSHTTRFQEAFVRGLNYILEAQYPNGGWPQVYPLRGGYHDSITFNDGAMVNTLNLLDDIARSRPDYSFVPASRRRAAADAVARGIQCILEARIPKGVWCQQHDPLSLRPVSARNYEMPCQSSSESTGLLLFLMTVDQPSPRIINAVQEGTHWLREAAIKDVAFIRLPGEDRKLISSPGQGPLWARFYGIDTAQPIFGDRDRTIHNNVNDISPERRNGYSWYTTGPAQALKAYDTWSRRHPSSE